MKIFYSFLINNFNYFHILTIALKKFKFRQLYCSSINQMVAIMLMRYILPKCTPKLCFATPIFQPLSSREMPFFKPVRKSGNFGRNLFEFFRTHTNVMSKPIRLWRTLREFCEVKASAARGGLRESAVRRITCRRILHCPMQ